MIGWPAEVPRAEPVEPPRDRPPGGEPLAVSLGLIALALAITPIALFLLTPDDGLRGAWAFADAKNWLALRRFALASLLALAPTFALLRLARDRSRRRIGRWTAAIALACSLPLIPGTLIQLAWWLER